MPFLGAPVHLWVLHFASKFIVAANFANFGIRGSQ